MSESSPAAEPEPSSLWRYLSERPRPSKVVAFFHKDGEITRTHIRLQPLTAIESSICATAAHAFAKKALKDETDRDAGTLAYERIYANQLMLEVLARVAKRPNENAPALPPAALMGGVLTSQELDSLFAAYLTVCDELGPMAGADERDFEGLITAIAEEQSAYPYDALPRRLQHELLLYACTQLRPLAEPLADTSPETTSPA